MSDDITGTEAHATGRSIQVLAFGDNPEELELDAIDKARKFFGGSVRLEVERSYRVDAVLPGGALEKDAGGKNWFAVVTLREPTGGQS
jgi:hypothetical protein